VACKPPANRQRSRVGVNYRCRLSKLRCLVDLCISREEQSDIKSQEIAALCCFSPSCCWGLRWPKLERL
jgi:hypothetical protein